MPFELAECQRVIGYHFANPKLLEIALTHSSLRTPDRECNERLEFLGDSVLGLVVTEELYRLLPDQAEGELTRFKSAVVSRGSLYRTSQRLGLARFAEFARGVSRREELPVSVTANLTEAVIGAIYLDAGYFPAREFVLRHLGAELEAVLEDRGAKNYKSLLQHEVQEALRLTPTYRTLEEGGPDHKKQFVVAAVIRGQEWGRAEGGTKKDAEQEAARQALEAFQRRGRGRRRRRGERDADQLVGAREVAEHVDDEAPAPEADLEPPPLPDVEAGADLPPPEIEPQGPGPTSPDAPPPEPRTPAPLHRGNLPRDPQAHDPKPARSGPRPRRSATPRTPAASIDTPRPAASAAPDGFAQGLDAPPAAPVRERAAAAPPSAPASDVARVEARKKAPGAWTPAADEGFATGL